MKFKIKKNHYLNYFKKKRILITGNTGFVGSNVSIALNLLGAQILGYSLKKKDKKYISNSNQFNQRIKTIYDDINQITNHIKLIKKFKPQILIHLASQPIVKDSYEYPFKTYETNIMGTINLFEVAKKINTLKNILVFTSDKVYKNLEKTTLNESSPLGGEDPYSSSKSAQDLISSSYKNSFFKMSKNIFVVRAGNIIGGGDWEKSRLVPDFFISNQKKKNILLRNSKAIRPWQHIYDVINGIFKLLSSKGNKIYSKPFIYNIGPSNSQNITVLDLIKKIKKNHKNININYSTKKINFKEKKILKLSNKLLIKEIGWKQKLNINNSIKLTFNWYNHFYKNQKSIFKFTEKQILEFFK